MLRAKTLAVLTSTDGFPALLVNAFFALCKTSLANPH